MKLLETGQGVPRAVIVAAVLVLLVVVGGVFVLIGVTSDAKSSDNGLRSPQQGGPVSPGPAAR